MRKCQKVIKLHWLALAIFATVPSLFSASSVEAFRCAIAANQLCYDHEVNLCEARGALEAARRTFEDTSEVNAKDAAQKALLRAEQNVHRKERVVMACQFSPTCHFAFELRDGVCVPKNKKCEEGFRFDEETQNCTCDTERGFIRLNNGECIPRILKPNTDKINASRACPRGQVYNLRTKTCRSNGLTALKRFCKRAKGQWRNGRCFRAVRPR